MQIVIEISDDRIEDFIKNGESALNEDEFKNVMAKAVDKYLSDPENLKNIFEEEDSIRYGRINPSKVFEKMLLNIDLTKDCEDARNAILDYIKSNSNNIVTDILTHAIVKSLFSTAKDSWWFEEAIRQSIRQCYRN